MRFDIVRSFVVVVPCLALVACAPATPPAQEPSVVAPPAAGGSGGGPADAAGGGPIAAGTAGMEAGASTVAGAPSTGGGAEASARLCGGIAGRQCGPKEYCSFPAGAHCGAADMSGTCAKMPDACIQMVDEVCGCDDKTYSNACMAAQAGVSVLGKGACKPPETTAEGGLCGTRGASRDCSPGLYCKYKPDCGTTDAGGVCSKVPTMCTKIYKPVCGCNGKNYGNACTAAAEGVSVVKEGNCSK